MVELGNIVTEVYANGGELILSKDRTRIGLKGNLPARLYKEVEENQERLLKALTGDPFEGPGWEARTALYRQALRWLDARTPIEARKRTTGALCRVSVADRLNEAWGSEAPGAFEEYRTALKEYVRVGLDAASGKKQKMEMKA